MTVPVQARQLTIPKLQTQISTTSVFSRLCNLAAAMKSLLFISLVFTALMASTFARPSAYYAGYQSNSQPQTKNRALLRSLLDVLMTEHELFVYCAN